MLRRGKKNEKKKKEKKRGTEKQGGKKKRSIVILYPQLATLYLIPNKLITAGVCIVCSPGNTELNPDNSRRPFRREFKGGDCIS